MIKIIVAVLLCAGSINAFAGTFSDNPDHATSIGINYTGVATSGDLTLKSGGISASQDAETTSGALVIDTRIPVSQNVTLNAALGFVGFNATADETALLDGGESDESGMLFNVGVRFYLK